MYLDITYIFLYSAACAVYLPLPSEAPMFLFPRLPRIVVLIACALGKGLGAYLVFVSGDRFRQTRLFNRIMSFVHLDKPWLRISLWMEAFMLRTGFIGFLICMSIPGMPMRSAIYSVSFLRINALKFTTGVMLGTMVRNSLVYFGYLGILTLLR